MATIKLNQLQKLAEASGDKKLSGAVYKLSEKVDDLYDDLENVVKSLESDVLTGQFTAAGFPATEHKATKEAARKAYDALGKLADELQDLHMATASHFNMEDDE